MSDIFSLRPPDLYVTVRGKSACKRPHYEKKKDFTHRLIQFSKAHLKVRDLPEKWQSSSSWNPWCSGHVWGSSLSNIHALSHPLGTSPQDKNYRDSQSHNSDRCRNRRESSLPPPTTVLACFNFILLKKTFPFKLIKFYYYGMHVTYVCASTHV